MRAGMIQAFCIIYICAAKVGNNPASSKQKQITSLVKI